MQVPKSHAMQVAFNNLCCLAGYHFWHGSNHTPKDGYQVAVKAARFRGYYDELFKLDSVVGEFLKLIEDFFPLPSKEAS